MNLLTKLTCASVSVYDIEWDNLFDARECKRDCICYFIRIRSCVYVNSKNIWKLV